MDTAQAVTLVNESVRRLAAYHLQPQPADIKLNQNENPWDWPADVKEEMAAFCRERPWNRYPPFIPEQLKAALADYTGVPAEGIIVGNGSNETLLVLLLALMDRARPVILCQPTFTVYQLLVQGMGGQVCSVPLRAGDLTFDRNALVAACAANPGSLAILCSPNNPTGCSLSEQDLRAVLAVHTGMLILDQAYVEFGGFDAIPLLAEFPNLVITRTFSKALAGAGLRIGYLLGAPAVVGEINKVKLPYNINFFTDRVAQLLLKNRGWARERVAALRAERDRLIPLLEQAGFERVYPSDANFILARTGRKNELTAHLAKARILIRDVSQYPMLEQCVRVNVGTPQENNTLIATLNAFFGRAQ
jgi:histidinol-phosphate aminotransferase